MRRAASPGAFRRRLPAPRFPGAGLLFLTALLASGAGPGPHRTSSQITEILARGPHAGDCVSCHTMHAGGQLPEFHALIGPDDNSLCDRCHTTSWSGGSYADPTAYARSSHGSGTSVIWPGPTPPPRTEPDAAGKCVNCHDPHGQTDALGDVPGLALSREESLCLQCHDGSPATADIASDLLRPFRHPITDRRELHTGPAESLPSDFGAAPLNRRHAECVDCHNPHIAYRDPSGPPLGSGLSKVNLGTSRVRVLNGGPGAPPAFTFIAAADTLSPDLAEYEICFKCHSSWTTQPSGQTDLALELNPANPSYHPVEAPGRDLTLRLGAFTPGWSPSSTTRCGSCHGSSAGNAEGPHGSSYRYILRQPYTASPDPRAMAPDELCFSCHANEVYASASAPDLTRQNSRFNKPGVDKGHAEHVDEARVPCYSCHVTHGSTTQPHLIATGRSPGILTYTETPDGGTCTPTCHGIESYTVNYAR